MDDVVARKLLATTDANVWADEFLAQPHIHIDPLDRGVIVTWFANAIETGRTHGGKMTMERFEALTEAALGSGSPATARLVAGAFISAAGDFGVDDDTALGNVVALFIGLRGYKPSEEINEAVFKRAAQAALREINAEPFEKLERPQAI